MQLGHLKGNIIEKVLFDKNGRLVHATFCVYERGGRIKAQILKVTFINQLPGDSSFVLSTTYENELVSILLSEEKGIESPYIKQTLKLSGSKPRAPTF